LEISKDELKDVFKASLTTIQQRDSFGATYTIYYPKSKQSFKCKVAIPINY